RPQRRVHGDRLGRPRGRGLLRPTGVVRHGRLRRRPGRLRRRPRPGPPPRRRPLLRRHPRPGPVPPPPRRPEDADPGLGLRRLVRLPPGPGRPPAPPPGPGPGRRCSAPPPAEAAGQRLRQAMALADLPPEEFAGTLLPTIFREGTPAETLAPFAASVRAFHPAGFRAMARASAQNPRDVPPKVEVPTLLVYGAEDVRAPLPVAKDLEVSIPASTLVVLDGAGHACNLEAPDEFNQVVRAFLREQ